MPGKYDGTGVEMSGQIEPFPPGEYHLRIMETELGETKKGDTKVTVNFKVVDGPYADRRVNFHTVTFLPKSSKGAGMVLHFLKCIGEPYEGEFEWDERLWVGRVLKAVVGIYVDDQRREWNSIERIMEPDEMYRTANQNRRNAINAGAGADEQIPF